MRERRRSLSATQQRIAAQGASRQLAKLAAFRQAKSIAIYFANDGEISPHLIAQQARRESKKIYCPVLRRQAMFFREYPANALLHRNHYGIREPLPRYAERRAQEIDIIILPLVAFDQHGNRLGMGGGYYDRSFAFKRNVPFTPPRLIGLAHSVQQTDYVPIEEWDIGLDYLITESRIISCKRFYGRK